MERFEGQSHQRTIPADGRGESRHVSHSPDAPQVVTREYRMTGWDYHRMDLGAVGVAIDVTVPITPVFETPIGGKRVGGGGTSREALHRARRKLRHLRRH